MPGAMRCTRTLFSLPHPHTPSGQPFTDRSSRILKAIARSREYTDGLWVAMQLVKPLSLTLDEQAEHAVRLDAMNGTCFYYHCSQFAEQPHEIKDRWRAWKHTTNTPAQPETSASHVGGSDGTFSTPLNTNGEPLGEEPTAALRRRFISGERWGSPYWATAAEAAHVFQAPFPAAYVAQRGRAVMVPNRFSSPTPLAYFNVEGSSRPAAFSPVSCRRYDPYNYQGQFYSPAVCLAMKRLAVRHNCLDCSRWMTPERIECFGARPLPNAEPLLIMIEGTHLLSLVNLAQTTNPARLEACAVNTRPGFGGRVRNGGPQLEDSVLLTATHDEDDTDDVLADPLDFSEMAR